MHSSKLAVFTQGLHGKFPLSSAAGGGVATYTDFRSRAVALVPRESLPGVCSPDRPRRLETSAAASEVGTASAGRGSRKAKARRCGRAFSGSHAVPPLGEPPRSLRLSQSGWRVSPANWRLLLTPPASDFPPLYGPFGRAVEARHLFRAFPSFGESFLVRAPASCFHDEAGRPTNDSADQLARSVTMVTSRLSTTRSPFRSQLRSLTAWLVRLVPHAPLKVLLVT